MLREYKDPRRNKNGETKGKRTLLSIKIKLVKKKQSIKLEKKKDDEKRMKNLKKEVDMDEHKIPIEELYRRLQTHPVRVKLERNHKSTIKFDSQFHDCTWRNRV